MSADQYHTHLMHEDKSPLKGIIDLFIHGITHTPLEERTTPSDHSAQIVTRGQCTVLTFLSLAAVSP